MSVSLGLLTPRSGLYPSLAFDLRAGLQAGLHETGNNTPSIVSENINFGEKDALIYSLCEKLLLQGCPIVAAYINPSTALHLQPLFEAAGGLLLALDSGYHFPTHESALPNVVFLSLQGTLCCRAVTSQAIQDGYTSLGFAASYYDAGYRSSYVIARALEAAGIIPLFNHITALKKKEFTLEPMRRWLEAETPPGILASFCGDMGSDFLNGLAQFEKRPAALYGSPYLAEAIWRAKSRYPGLDFKACVPWDATLPLPANNEFSARLAGRTPTIFSLLGYEAGLLATTVVQSGAQGAEAAALLVKQVFESPRGDLRFDAATQQTIAPVYTVTIGEDAATGCCQLLGLPEPVAEVQAHWDALQEDIASMRGVESTNWQNAYPCIES